MSYSIRYVAIRRGSLSGRNFIDESTLRSSGSGAQTAAKLQDREHPELAQEQPVVRIAKVVIVEIASSAPQRNLPVYQGKGNAFLTLNWGTL